MPPKASENTCDWCSETAVQFREIKHKLSKGTVPTGMFMFACGQHIETLKRTIAAKAEEKLKR